MTELLLAVARRNEFLSVVQSYQALGGGWSEPPTSVAGTGKPNEPRKNP
jgi:outer membrane protein TolC